MAIQRPTVTELQDVAKSLHMTLSTAEAEEYLSIMEANFAAYDVVDELDDGTATVYDSRESYRPSAEENPLNAWYYKTNIQGAAAGALVGRSVVLKDNIALAGVPMMNGSSTLEGFVPRSDATIVSRLLDAGATIVGKSTCEHFCLSAGSHTSDPAAVHNPYKEGYTSGGSSSGSAVLVAKGEVDLAIGGDQGGSIRIPSSVCGIYGLKPTHGLVPYTGIMPIESTIDHTGPMTATVADNALLLEVLAGEDGLDPRQYSPKTDQYTASLDRGVKGLKIGILKEGFSAESLDARVDAKVRAALDVLQQLGADVEEVSIPEHHLATALWSPIGCEGLTQQMMLGNGMGFNWKGKYDVGLIDHHAKWREQADNLSVSLKVSMLIGQYGVARYQGRYYAKAQNLVRKAKAAYDQALEKYDVLVMPTIPMVPQALPDADASITASVKAAFEMLANTSAQDITGHPALSMPVGMIEGLPTGMMLVGPYYGEAKLYQTAAAFEAARNWREC